MRITRRSALFGSIAGMLGMGTAKANKARESFATPVLERGFASPQEIRDEYTAIETARKLFYFENILLHSAGEWRGKPFLLAPWQEALLSASFRRAYIELPRKNGATETLAGLILFYLCEGSSDRQDILSANKSIASSQGIFITVCRMVEQSKFLRQNLRVIRSSRQVINRNTGKVYRALWTGGDKLDGLDPELIVVDDLRRWNSDLDIDMWHCLGSGGPSIKIAITTASSSDSESPLAYGLHEKTRHLEQGGVEYPGFYGRIYGADRSDDPSDPKTWIKANPSLIENGGFLELARLREVYQRSVAEGTLEYFKLHYLNMRSTA